MRYTGGKGGCFRHLVNLMPPHDVYIETHLGGGNVLERKKPAEHNIGVDIDPDVIRVFSAHYALHAGSQNFHFHQGDAVEFLRRYRFTGRELVYSDPPYLHETRSRRDLYRFEYTDAQHANLLGVLVSLPCAVMVSGYFSEIYQATLEHRHGWRRIEFESMTRQGLRTECVWLNFEPGPLHDTRFVGGDYRERERIKKKKNRWRARLAAMDAAERQAIMDALRDLASPAPTSCTAAPADAFVGCSPGWRAARAHLYDENGNLKPEVKP